VPLIGVESGGAQRWLGFGEYSFQPSEIMKIALVLAIARYYQWLPPEKIWRPDAVLAPVLMIGVPTILALGQPDLGTAALFALVGCGLLFLAGVSWLYFIGGLVGIIAVLPHVWEKLHDYQKERVLTLIEPDRDPLGSGYHILQSKIAIGSGGLFGKGWLQGTQSSLNFLPEKQTDFIFTTFVEEWGMVGALVLLALFTLILVWGFSIALRSQHHFGRLVALGVTAMMFLYVFINTAMVMGLLPVVGVPLPLVSNGGTAMVSVMFACGLLIGVNVYRDAQLPIAR
jgi:rod shape determining protein RodA